jgi:hypothetical protein
MTLADPDRPTVFLVPVLVSGVRLLVLQLLELLKSRRELTPDLGPARLVPDLGFVP